MCFSPSPVRRVPSPNRYMAVARFCFCKNNKRTIIKKTQKLAVHAVGCAHNGGEKGNVLIVSVLLSITIYFALRSETQGGVKVLRM